MKDIKNTTHIYLLGPLARQTHLAWPGLLLRGRHNEGQEKVFLLCVSSVHFSRESDCFPVEAMF